LIKDIKYNGTRVMWMQLTPLTSLLFLKLGHGYGVLRISCHIYIYISIQRPPYHYSYLYMGFPTTVKSNCK